MSRSYSVCLDIGGTKVFGAIFNEENEIVYRLKKKTKECGDSTANVEKVIISVVDEMLQGFGIGTDQVHAIGDRSGQRHYPYLCESSVDGL